MRNEILRMEHITLEENGERYLDDLNFYILQGEIMGLIISEAKGKQQLMNLICNNQPIEFGRVYYDGTLVNQYAYSDLSHNKVYIIEEQGRLIESLTISDNLFVLRKGFKKYMINNKILDRQVEHLISEMGISIDPRRGIPSLNAFERCVIELLKAVLMGCKLIILDHVSNFLSQRELVSFQEVVGQVSKSGAAFLYVGNHHQEVFQIADRAALFRQGMIWKVFEPEEMTDQAIKPYTISFDLTDNQVRFPQTEAILTFQGVRLEEGDKPLDFSLKKGECLMILDRDNQTWEAIAHVLSGIKGIDSGHILLEEHAFGGTEPVDYLREGIAVIPDDPQRRFLFRHMNYLENLTFLLDRKVKFGNVRKNHLKSVRKEYMKKVGLCIDVKNIDDLKPQEQYGLAYYRVHLLHPKVAVCVQPLAKGDMYCRRYVLDLIQEFKNSGISVLILTSNIADNMDVSDRMLVLQEGNIVAEYGKQEFYKVGW